jgi:hypothetical protein
MGPTTALDDLGGSAARNWPTKPPPVFDGALVMGPLYKGSTGAPIEPLYTWILNTWFLGPAGNRRCLGVLAAPAAPETIPEGGVSPFRAAERRGSSKTVVAPMVLAQSVQNRYWYVSFRM